MSKFSFPKKETEEIKVDPAALEAFAAGAKECQGPKLWAQHDPKAPPRHNVSVRLNDYHLEMLRYVAEELDTSQHKLLRKHLVPMIERLAEEMYAERMDK